MVQWTLRRRPDTLEEKIVNFRLAAFQPDIAPNLGAMIRLCSCFGLGLDVIGPCGFAMSDKRLRRAAMDYSKRADVRLHVSWDVFRAAFRPGRLVLLSTAGTCTLWDFAFASGDTLMVGRESAGVPEDVRAAADAAVAIPMPGGGRSLNVAMAAGIALSEAQRQLRAL